MIDPLIQTQIQQDQTRLKEELAALHQLQIQSEVFTLKLFWERLFSPTYNLIKDIQAEIPVGWNITDSVFTTSGKCYLSITMTPKDEEHNQYTFDQFLAKFADSNTSLDTYHLEHRTFHRLDKFILSFSVKIPVSESTLTTLRDLGKIQTSTSSSEYLTCDISF